MAAQAYTVEEAPFPAKTKTSSAIAHNRLTTVTTVSFADRILVTISQSGKLSHWMHVPLATASTDAIPLMGSDENSLLPRSDLTATTVLGGTKREDEVVGQTLATTIASSVLVQRPREERLLVVAVGLDDAVGMGMTGFEEIVGLVLDCL